MNNIDCYPSSGFEGVLHKATWQGLQKYLADASNLPRSPDPQTEATLKKIENAAVAFHTNVLPEANKLGNTLYNYAQTASASLQGLSGLMGQASPPKTAIEQLVANLKTSASGALPGTLPLAHGLASFRSTTAVAGKSLAQRLAKEKTKISNANETISAKALDLKQQLTGADLDTAAIEADMQAIQQAADQFAGISLVGLTFSVAPGVSAANDAAAGITALAGAWSVLIKQLGDLEVQITKATEAELKQVPCLSQTVLATAANEWNDIANDAHDFMMNFYVTTG